MKQNNPNMKKVVRTVYLHFPHLIPIVGIFACVLFIAAIVNYYMLREQVMSDGSASISQLERYIDTIADNLQVLELKVGEDCSAQDRLDLKSEVFNSELMKEVGLYNNGVVYCTSNEGQTKIRLFSSTLQRIQASENNITVTLRESKSRLQTIFIYVARDQRHGINALLPPQQFLDLVSPAFDKRMYRYQIKVMDQVIQSNFAETKIDRGESYHFSSNLYPFTISIFLSLDAYKQQYLAYLDKVILIALVLSLIYVLLRYQTLARLSIEYALLTAIKEEQIELYLQPIVDIRSRKLVGSEALVRWNHPVQGKMSPEQFIPLAEKLGAIDKITKYIFKEITRFLENNPAYLNENYISINISLHQIVETEFVRYLERYKEQYPDHVSRILLELTENVELTSEQLSIALANLKAIQDLGFDIAIDDFGTGYSGLNLVRMMKFNVVKIDQVFIKSLHTDSNIKPVLKSMIQLANDLEMKVIAEGVETESQIEQLQLLGVKYIQGFYYAKPIKPEELATFHQMTNEALDLSQPIPRWKS